MNILNKYTYLLIGLLGIAGIVILVFLPNLETEEFSQDVIDDIIEGVTTTSILEADTDEASVDESLGNVEDELIISIQDKSQIEEMLLYNNFEKEIDSFDTYLLIGSDERSEKIAETRGEIEGKRADVIILGLVEKGTDEITLLSFPRDLLIENNDLIKVLDEKNLSGFRENAFRIANNYDINIILPKYVEFYKNILNKG